MITDTKVRILSYIRTNGQARVKDLAYHLEIGRVALHRHLKSMTHSGQLSKAGIAPKVFYTLAKKSSEEIAETNQLLDNY